MYGESSSLPDSEQNKKKSVRPSRACVQTRFFWLFGWLAGWFGVFPDGYSVAQHAAVVLNRRHRQHNV